ncbi:aminoacylase-1-like [Eurosta solidaginis]|uniref:aminoacylase-1-like n=1 Tax=Eurosta solidaginis TaxID=178769 RepID=UPI003530C5B5
MSAWKDNQEIEFFREYLRIPSVHPDIDYEPCVEFLKRQAIDLGLPIEVFYCAGPTKPVVVITWVGQRPDLPTIILNSHMDVVPVFPEKWTYPPFSAHMDDQGRIYARGSQDMKCVGMQYLAAIRALRKNGVTLKRTIHMTFVPDEEVGGNEGMRVFVKSKEFKKLNVGFSLDEGIASPDETFPVYYAERSIWHVKFILTGTAGHGSLLLENTVGEKFLKFFNKVMEFRQHEVQRLESDTSLTIGDVTTINLTCLNGGVQSNVVPPTLEAVLDIRLALSINHDAFAQQLSQWCEEAGGGIKIEYKQKQPKVEATKIDNFNPFWTAFKQASTELGLKIKTLVFPGGTDSRYIRQAGIPAIGFSPMNHTPVLLHDHDEFLQADVYLKGIEYYKKIIPAVTNV